MKSKVALLSLVSLIFTFAASAQGIENDDMYFNSKDRAKLNAKKATEVSYTASIKKNKKEVIEENESVNPTDSYSSRNVNPEYAARSNSEAAQTDNQDYFVNNYQYNKASNFNNFNNNFSNWYNNPWYRNNYYDPYNSWNSPYYGSYYDSWGNPWRNPYYRNGWSSSFSYSWGNSWDYGWGSSFGVGYGYNSYYGNPYRNGWGSGYYNNYYPNTVIIVNNNNESGRGVVYGKRATSRSVVSGQNLNRDSSSPRSRSTVSGDQNGGRLADDNSGGRVSTAPSRRQQDEYYNRSWRSTNSQGSQSTPTRSSTTGDNSNSNSGNVDRSYNDSNQRSRTFDSPTPTRSSGSYDGGGSSRSSSSGSTGSSGGSRGRSRD